MTLEDTFGNPTTKTTATTVNLASTSSGAKFATPRAAPRSPASSLPANTQSVYAFYGDTVAGSPTITASVTSGLTTESQGETRVTPGCGDSARHDFGWVQCHGLDIGHTCLQGDPPGRLPEHHDEGHRHHGQPRRTSSGQKFAASSGGSA